jgi:hypothetical protein
VQLGTRMDRQAQSSTTSTILLGLLAAGIGLFYLLYALGIFGPAAHGNGKDPIWLGFVFGLIFLFGGLAVVIQTAVNRGAASEETLPASMPPFLKLIHHVMALAIVASLGILASWVAFGPGARHFTGSGSILGEAGGRLMFGIGAVLVWVVLLAMAVSAVRRLFSAKGR